MQGGSQEHVAGHRFPWHVALAVFWLQTALKNRALRAPIQPTGLLENLDIDI